MQQQLPIYQFFSFGGKGKKNNALHALKAFCH